jgi:hypothetical protein
MTIPFGQHHFKAEDARRCYLRQLHDAFTCSASASNFKTTTCSYIVTNSREFLGNNLEDFITRIDSFKAFPNFYNPIYKTYKHCITFERDNKQRHIDLCAHKISALEGTIRSFETYITSAKDTICQLNQQASDLTFTSELLKNLTPELRAIMLPKYCASSGNEFGDIFSQIAKLNANITIYKTQSSSYYENGSIPNCQISIRQLKIELARLTAEAQPAQAAYERFMALTN